MNPASLPNWLQRNLTRIVACLTAGFLFSQARLPDSSAAEAAHLPMTSAGSILFSLYMFPDPATTPIKPLRQVFFGLSVATIYALLFVEHVVFGLFIALVLTSATRGLSLHAYALWKSRLAPKKPVSTEVPAAIGMAS
jgi:hypothetical protein